ncbi:MAG: FHA domain-containing protein [Bacteroidota bacterium]
MRRLLILLLALSLFSGPPGGVRAQGQASAYLYPPDALTFPSVSALVDVFDASGIFATGLKPEAFMVVEDGQPHKPDEVIEQALPAQIVLAINPGPALDVRDGQGISRFQRLSQVLDGWAQTLSTSTPDDLSLVSISGPVISHANAADFRNSLKSFSPDFRSTTPNLQSLALAMDIVTMQAPLPGMKRAILFVTPHMDDPDIASALQPLIDRAVQNKIRVFVWFVDLDAYFVTTSAAAFSMLALQSGGSLFGYSGSQPFPNPESYFAPLRRVYSLKYTSSLTGAGEHSLAVNIALPSGVVMSPEQKFNLDIQPPNPMLVSPPLQITRQAPAEDPFNTRVLVPEEQPIRILIEFPDGHPRPLVRTSFYVDGQIVDENTSQPFDTFQWDLKGYELSGQHQIMVEAVDAIGLSKTSIAIPVTVTVIQPPRGVAAMFARYRLPMTAAAVSLAGLALALVLLRGRVRIPGLKARRAAQQADRDPLTQPIPAVPEPPSTPLAAGKRKKEAAPVRIRLADAPARLVRLTADGQPATDRPIPLADKEIVFGTDPVQCSLVLDDPSIAPVHARLKQTPEEEFILLDNGSVAGTWVNYELVPREGRRLKSGDLIHFGQMIYRFQLRTPPPIPQATVTLEKPVL